MTVRLDTAAIKKAMAEKRLTGRSLAALVGITPQSVYSLFAKERCSHITAALIADALHMSVDEIWKEG